MLIFVATDKEALAQKSITLSQCYEWATANYPKIHQYGLIHQTEHLQLSSIKKAWVPQLSFNARASYQSDVTQLPFDKQQLATLMPGVDIPQISKNQYHLAAQIDQTIWDGGLSRSSRSLAKAEAEVERKSLESELYAIRERINQLYFGCLLQRELIKQNLILQDNLKTNTKRIRVMMENGEANQSDVDLMQVELLNAQQKEIELRSSLVAFRQMLSAFINQPIKEGTELIMPKLPDKFNHLTINHPELQALHARNELLTSRNRQVTAGIMPRFSAFIQSGFGRPALNMLSNDFEGYYVAGVKVSWNLGRLYTLRNDRRKIETGQKSIDIQRETFLFNTRLQLLQQDSEINKMQQLIKTDEEIIRLRQQVCKASEVILKNGTITVSDLIVDINAANSARQLAAAHQIQYLMNVYSRLHTTN